ncbi:MAG: hypothetical protein DMG71_13980 [Acidobacteria bacterium]|nr:MAG: hypothetical protein DMG71_13980 [Acidobacteriota bacterium]
MLFTSQVQAARTVAVFALQRLLPVGAASEILGWLLVAGLALIRPQPLRSRNLHKLREELVAVVKRIAV